MNNSDNGEINHVIKNTKSDSVVSKEKFITSISDMLIVKGCTSTSQLNSNTTSENNLKTENIVQEIKEEKKEEKNEKSVEIVSEILGEIIEKVD
mmetsp:Transcript_2953/g.436  ORF Transcript_2953/g.436 Transcript_2953/m.436 type:complete len:94 (-) Transcript_2953:248-529(-)